MTSRVRRAHDRRTARADRITTAGYAEVALDLARAQGCDCVPEIEVLPAHLRAGTVTDLRVAHDDWCALLTRLSDDS